MRQLTVPVPGGRLAVVDDGDGPLTPRPAAPASPPGPKRSVALEVWLRAP